MLGILSGRARTSPAAVITEPPATMPAARPVPSLPVRPADFAELLQPSAPQYAALSRAALLLCGVLLLAACARVGIRVPFSVVPVTGQTFGVLLLAALLAMVTGNVIIYACGLPWPALSLPADQVLAQGLYPFLPGDAMKVTVASLMLSVGWRVLALGGLDMVRPAAPAACRRTARSA